MAQTQRKTHRREGAAEGGANRAGGETATPAVAQKPDILGAITPAVRDVQNFIEGSPVRAAAVGAIAGGLLMTLFATEKGRVFLKSALSFANPIITKYAREFVSKAAGDMTESALLQ